MISLCLYNVNDDEPFENKRIGRLEITHRSKILCWSMKFVLEIPLSMRIKFWIDLIRSIGPSIRPFVCIGFKSGENIGYSCTHLCIENVPNRSVVQSAQSLLTLAERRSPIKAPNWWTCPSIYVEYMSSKYIYIRAA